MIESKPVQEEIRTLISLKNIVIPMLEHDITAKTSVAQRLFNDLVKVEERLICNYQIFIQGRSVDYLKSLLVSTLFLIFLSSCQTQQREQIVTQAENQTAIESIHSAEKDRVGRETSELLRILRGYIKEAETDPIYKNLAQRLLITISQNNKTYGFGLEEVIEYHQKEIENLKN